MRAFSIGMLSFFSFYFNSYGYDLAENNKLSNKIICLDWETDPKLFYLCFKKSSKSQYSSFYLYPQNEVLEICDFSDFDTSHVYKVANVFCNSIYLYLLEEDLNRISLDNSSSPFLADKYDITRQFVADFNLREQQLIINSPLKGKNSALIKQINRKEKPNDFDSSLLLFAVIALSLVVLGYFQAPRFIAKDEQKKTRAIRKKWINSLFDKDIIDANEREHLLKNLDYLPKVVKSRLLYHKDLPIYGLDSELRDALTKKMSN
jgi:hypothetical protein